MSRNIIAHRHLCIATRRGYLTAEQEHALAHRADIADRAHAIPAVAAVRAPDVLIALNTLIIAVSLVLLSGAVWMHAT